MRIYNDRRKTGYIIAIVLLSAAIITTMTFMFLYMFRNQKYRNELENLYERAYYELLEDTNNMEIEISKLTVTGSDEIRSRLLYDISKQSENAATSIASLPVKHESMMSLMGFINQIGGYTSSLLKSKKFEESELKNMQEIYAILKDINGELKGFSSEVGTSFKFSDNSLKNFTINNPLGGMLDGLHENNIKYPTLIYDGPFSKALGSGEVKGLNYNEVSKDEAQKNISKFVKEDIKNITYEGEISSNGIATYSFNITSASDRSIYLQITKKGGKLIHMSGYENMSNANIDKDSAIKKCEDYLNKIGFENMKSVWYMQDLGVATINLAPIVDDIVYYPDLVKVKISLSTGNILGVEATEYHKNHTTRSLNAKSQDFSNVKYEISKQLTIKSERYALIPEGQGIETLTMEINASANDLDYFIYLDLKSGKEVEILRVIDTEQGSLIM